MSMSILQLVVATVGLMIGTVCILGFAAPGRLIGFAREFWTRSSSLFVAVVARLMLGILLIAVAPVSRFPLVLKSIGVLSVVVALGILFIGEKHIARLIDGLVGLPLSLIRFLLLFGIGFAAWLVFAVSGSS